MAAIRDDGGAALLDESGDVITDGNDYAAFTIPQARRTVIRMVSYLLMVFVNVL